MTITSLNNKLKIQKVFIPNKKNRVGNLLAINLISAMKIKRYGQGSSSVALNYCLAKKLVKIYIIIWKCQRRKLIY
jgi:hypothetical protein